jgi:UDP-N-acetylglucosamine--N-acetylmuramyl-(pentapeptide) pyrophosphoryl-undecaprenol N-acetylglucosamine transferase
LISGGGTGGHVYPLLVVADALKQTADELDILYVGHHGGLEEPILSRTDLSFEKIASGPIRGTSPWTLAQSLHRLWRGYRQSRALLDRWPADVVLTSGGYVSVPVVLAARRSGVPVMVYLPDLKPGLAVRLQSRLANRIAVSFDEAKRFFPERKVWVSGYPVRASIFGADRTAGYRMLALDPTRKTLLGFGGSRGARPINQALIAGLPELVAEHQVVHVTGQLDWPWVQERRDTLPAEIQAHYHAYPYLHDEQLFAAFATADLVVARAGAATTAEFPAAGLPSILVPYPYSGQHQQLNADFMVAHGAAVCIDNAELSEKLVPTVNRLLSDNATLEQMSQCARALSRPDAAHRLASELERLAHKGEE